MTDPGPVGDQLAEAAIEKAADQLAGHALLLGHDDDKRRETARAVLEASGLLAECRELREERDEAKKRIAALETQREETLLLMDGRQERGRKLALEMGAQLEAAERRAAEAAEALDRLMQAVSVARGTPEPLAVEGDWSTYNAAWQEVDDAMNAALARLHQPSGPGGPAA